MTQFILGLSPMKNYLKTLIAIIVLAALWGGITYYNKRQSKEKPKAAETK